MTLLGGLLVPGCGYHDRPPATQVVVSAPGELVVADAPPAPIVEVQPVCPGPDFVWIGGVWVWGPGGRWEWERGRWDRPPRPGVVWVPHRYETRGGRRVFVRGGWR